MSTRAATTTTTARAIAAQSAIARAHPGERTASLAILACSASPASSPRQRSNYSAIDTDD